MPAGTDWSGRTLLIAGSSRGIGAATARRAAAAGAEVVVHGRRDGPGLRALADELGCRRVAFDAGDPAATAHGVGGLADAGVSVDALVCTLGAVASTPVLSGEPDTWTEQYRANVLAPLNVVRAVAPSMVARGQGRVVLVSSIRGRHALAAPAVAAYSAAKAALENLTVSLAKELAPQVTVNAVAPGFVLTDMAETWTDEVRAEVGRSLLGRAADADEIARVLLFLASDAAAFVTGHTLVADGGLTVRAT
ncbi:SDR family NAD(P)-dependent oxidoreductase [Nocardioides sp. BYT-33-1]|jgi:3-oxoacyl-[acyl-carrier protein] reductase|uniref:SDR family NAD(P)-dependent oxidoreductase n=1 Tax=Nocardioides sp. BYT-33-1 TaxID=3416952 RepID=UPI003F529A02